MSFILLTSLALSGGVYFGLRNPRTIGLIVAFAIVSQIVAHIAS